MSRDLVAMSRELAVEIGAREGVDGVFVFVYRKGNELGIDEAVAGAINAGPIAINTMVGMIVTQLGALRQKIIEDSISPVDIKKTKGKMQ